MNFRKTYDRIGAIPAPCSEKKIDKFRLTRDDKGNCHYKKVGELDIDQYVNSFAKGCSLSSLLERCSLMSPKEMIATLNRPVQPVYGDTTHLPRDLTEAMSNASNLAKEAPELAHKLANGESVESILNDIIKPLEATNESKEDNNNVES